MPESAATGTRSAELAFTSYLRVVAIVAVVLIHVAGMSYVQGDTAGLERAFAAVLTYATKWAVPVFVMVSGALLLAAPPDPSPTAFYRRRLSRIGVPLVVWHVVYAALILHTNETADWRVIAGALMRGEVYTALYFFWLILGLYLATPLLWPAVTHLSRRTLLAAGVGLTALPAADLVLRRLAFQVGRPMNTGDPTLLTQFVPYLGFFLLGYALRDVVLRSWRLGALAVVLAAALLLITLQAAYPGRLGDAVGVLDTLNPISYQGPLLGAASVGVYVLVRGLAHPGSYLAAPGPARVARHLGDLTMGVFGCHLLLFYVLSRTTGHPGLHGAETVPGILLQNAVVVGASFGLTWAAARVPYLRRAFGA